MRSSAWFCALVAGAVPAWAEELHHGKLTALHAKLDKDGDGKLTVEEILDYAKAHERKTKMDGTHFAEYDTNKDGKVSLEEYLEGFQKDMAAPMEVENGAPDLQEMHAEEMERLRPVEMEKFKAADENGDDALTMDEFHSLLHPHHFPDVHDKVSMIDAKRSLAEKDVDGDGKLSMEEFFGIEPGSEDPEDKLSDDEQDEFDLLDVNEDGFLTLEELKDFETEWFHTEKALRHMLHTADKDQDSKVTAQEFADALPDFQKMEEASEDILFHLEEWAKHHEL